MMRLTGALIDRLTHHVHILEMNGDSYHLKHAQSRSRTATRVATDAPTAEETIDPNTGEISKP